MSDQFQRVEKMNEQANALTESLQELLAGRPIDVVLGALGRVAGKLIIEEAGLTFDEIEHEILGARGFVGGALLEVVPSTHLDRLKFVLYLSQCLTLATPAINYPEGVL